MAFIKTNQNVSPVFLNIQLSEADHKSLNVPPTTEDRATIFSETSVTIYRLGGIITNKNIIASFVRVFKQRNSRKLPCTL